MASGNVASRAEVGASVDILMQKVYLGEDPGALVARYTDVVRPRGTSGTRSSKNGTNDDETGGDLASGTTTFNRCGLLLIRGEPGLLHPKSHVSHRLGWRLRPGATAQGLLRPWHGVQVLV